jgi:hypothetical protein
MSNNSSSYTLTPVSFSDVSVNSFRPAITKDASTANQRISFPTKNGFGHPIVRTKIVHLVAHRPFAIAHVADFESRPFVLSQLADGLGIE